MGKRKYLSILPKFMIKWFLSRFSISFFESFVNYVKTYDENYNWNQNRIEKSNILKYLYTHLMTLKLVTNDREEDNKIRRVAGTPDHPVIPAPVQVESE